MWRFPAIFTASRVYHVPTKRSCRPFNTSTGHHLPLLSHTHSEVGCQESREGPGQHELSHCRLQTELHRPSHVFSCLVFLKQTSADTELLFLPAQVDGSFLCILESLFSLLIHRLVMPGLSLLEVRMLSISFSLRFCFSSWFSGMNSGFREELSLADDQ